MAKIATRDAYGKTLAQLCEEREAIVVLDADLSGSTKSAMMKKVAPADDIPQDIIFWASQDECAYLDGKPVHSSMTHLKKRDAELRRKYHLPDNGKIFSINCIVNFELFNSQQLTSIICSY